MFTTIELIIMYIITIFMVFALLSKCLDIIKMHIICKTLNSGIKAGVFSKNDINQMLIAGSCLNVQNKGGK